MPVRRCDRTGETGSPSWFTAPSTPSVEGIFFGPMRFRDHVGIAEGADRKSVLRPPSPASSSYRKSVFGQKASRDSFLSDLHAFEAVTGHLNLRLAAEERGLEPCRQYLPRIRADRRGNRNPETRAKTSNRQRYVEIRSPLADSRLPDFITAHADMDLRILATVEFQFPDRRGDRHGRQPRFEKLGLCAGQYRGKRAARSSSRPNCASGRTSI